MPQEVPDVLHRGAGHAEILERRHALAMIEHAKHDLLAEDRPERRDAEVDRLAVFGGRADAAVLRQPLLGDVEPRHDLDAGDDPFVDPLGQVHHFFQQAVEAVTNDDVAFRGLDMNVARAALEGALDDELDHVDDRRRLGRGRLAGGGLLEDLLIAGGRAELDRADVGGGLRRRRGPGADAPRCPLAPGRGPVPCRDTSG